MNKRNREKSLLKRSTKCFHNKKYRLKAIQYMSRHFHKLSDTIFMPKVMRGSGNKPLIFKTQRGESSWWKKKEACSVYL